MTHDLKRAMRGLGLVVGLAVGAAPAALAQPPSARMTPSRAYDMSRLGPMGLAKCAAYKRVRQHSDDMQAADHGRLTAGDTRRLMAELGQARRRSPHALTPADCGVPL